MANEGADGVLFVQKVLEQCSRFATVDFFAVLDRVTTDNSLKLLRDYAQREPRLRVVWAPENRCVVDAYVRGYREALASGADWILEIDSGFSHDPEDLPRFLDAMERGYDCVFGSRFMPGSRFVRDSFKRYLVSSLGTILTNLLIGTSQTDMTSGFEMFSRQTLKAVLDIGIQSRAHYFQTEIKVFCRRLNFVEVPIHYRAPSPRLGMGALTDSMRQLFRLFRLRVTRALPMIPPAERAVSGVHAR